MNIQLTTQEFISDVSQVSVILPNGFRDKLFSDLYTKYRTRYQCWENLGLKVDNRGAKGMRCSEIHKIYNGKPIDFNLLKKISKINSITIEEIMRYIEYVGYFRTHKKGMLKLPIKIELNYSTGRLLGHLFGDGHVSRKSSLINYTNSDKNLVKNFIYLFFKTFGVKVRLCSSKNGLYTFSLRNKNYSWLIKKIISKIGHSGMSSDYECGFFSALFDDEGSVILTSKRAHAYFGMNKKYLVYGFHKWLVKNNIKPTKIFVDNKFRKQKFYYFYVQKKYLPALGGLLNLNRHPKSQKLLGVVS